VNNSAELTAESVHRERDGIDNLTATNDLVRHALVTKRELLRACR
jgi:hypothetical protein